MSDNSREDVATFAFGLGLTLVAISLGMCAWLCRSCDNRNTCLKAAKEHSEIDVAKCAQF